MVAFYRCCGHLKFIACLLFAFLLVTNLVVILLKQRVKDWPFIFCWIKIGCDETTTHYYFFSHNYIQTKNAIVLHNYRYQLSGKWISTNSVHGIKSLFWIWYEMFEFFYRFLIVANYLYESSLSTFDFTCSSYDAKLSHIQDVCKKKCSITDFYVTDKRWLLIIHNVQSIKRLTQPQLPTTHFIS